MMNLRLFNDKKDDPRRLQFNANVRSPHSFCNLSIGNHKLDDIVTKGESNVCYSLNLEELEALHTVIGSAIRGMKESRLQ